MGKIKKLYRYILEKNWIIEVVILLETDDGVELVDASIPQWHVVYAKKLKKFKAFKFDRFVLPFLLEGKCRNIKLNGELNYYYIDFEDCYNVALKHSYNKSQLEKFKLNTEYQICHRKYEQN